MYPEGLAEFRIWLDPPLACGCSEARHGSNIRISQAGQQAGAKISSTSIAFRLVATKRPKPMRTPPPDCLPEPKPNNKIKRSADNYSRRAIPCACGRSAIGCLEGYVDCLEGYVDWYRSTKSGFLTNLSSSQISSLLCSLLWKHVGIEFGSTVRSAVRNFIMTKHWSRPPTAPFSTRSANSNSGLIGDRRRGHRPRTAESPAKGQQGFHDTGRRVREEKQKMPRLPQSLSAARCRDRFFPDGWAVMPSQVNE